VAITQAQKDVADARIKDTAGFAVYDAARTACENEADPAAKYAKRMTANQLVGVCLQQAGIVP
jgi:hypothetical protein